MIFNFFFMFHHVDHPSIFQKQKSCNKAFWHSMFSHLFVQQCSLSLDNSHFRCVYRHHCFVIICPVILQVDAVLQSETCVMNEGHP